MMEVENVRIPKNGLNKNIFVDPGRVCQSSIIFIYKWLITAMLAL